MKRSRFSEEQIIAILKQQESGVATVDVCREHGISSVTFYKGRPILAGSRCRMPGDSRRWKTRT